MELVAAPYAGSDMDENQIRGDGQVYITDSGAFDAITTVVAMLVTATRPYESEFG